MSWRRLEHFHQRVALLLSVAVATVYIWFGALKVAGISPVEALVVQTLGGPDWVVPALGAAELLLGLLLVSGRWIRTTTALFLAHILGTFLVFVTAPDAAFQAGRPERLTFVGEFIVKNIVIAAAVAAVAGLRLVETRPTRRPRSISG